MRQELLEREMLSQPVRGLQFMLRRLAREYEFLPELAADGVFGERTLEAVMLFQRELHPPVTGVVDRGTWRAIVERWEAAERKNGPARSLRGFPGEGSKVEEGSARDYMIVPQTMFQVLSHYFQGITHHTPDGYHSRASADNVRWLQRAAGLEETGVMDRMTWDVLSRLYEIFIVKELEEAQEGFTGGWG